MKRVFVGFLLSVVLFGTENVLSQDSDFQTGKVVSVEKAGSTAASKGTDAPVSENRQKYNVTIQLNDTIYLCLVDSVHEYELESYVGKDMPVRVKGKTLDVKRSNGKIVKLSVVGSKKAE